MSVERRNNGPTTLEAYQAAPPPVNAPSPELARAVWELLGERLMPVGRLGRKPSAEERPRKMEDVAGSLLRWLAPAERGDFELTAKQAFAVAVDAVMAAGRDKRALFANDVFHELARRWSPLYRSTPGTSPWRGQKKNETLIDARREMLKAGVDFARIWSAVSDGIDGLYSTSLIGGKGHAQGRSVTRTRGPLRKQYAALMAGTERLPRRNRIMLAGTPMPPLKIDHTVVAEKEYDVMNVGEPTRQVIDLLQQSRVFLVVDEVKKDVARLRKLVDEHPWPKKLAEWQRPWVGATWKDRDSTKYRREWKAFIGANWPLRDEYRSLEGRLAQAKAVARQIRRHRKKVDEHGHLDIATGYYKTRNRRFQPRNLWPSEVSSQEDAELMVLPNETVVYHELLSDTFWPDDPDAFAREYPGPGVTRRPDGSFIVLNEDHPGEFKAKTSPRGRWFQVRAQFPGEHRTWKDSSKPDAPEWQDEHRGARRPLKGVDASGSMWHIASVVLGWRDAEKICEDRDIKMLMAEGVVELMSSGRIHPIDATLKQLRSGWSEIGNYAYGANLGGVVRELRRDPVKYGTGWGDSDNLKKILNDGREVSKAIDLVVRVREEYLTTAHELAAAAEARSAYDGLAILDPFDGTYARWHEPLLKKDPLHNGGSPLLTHVPIGTPNADGFYPANYRGRAVTTRGERTRWVDTKGCSFNLVVPGLIHALDAAYAAHVVLALHAAGVRDLVIVNDCFLVPSDGYPLLINALEDATKPWFRGLTPFYKTFEQLSGHPVVVRWRAAWAARLEECEKWELQPEDERGPSPWPKFTFKNETTVEVAPA